MLKKSGLLDAAPGRRVVRRPGRPGGPQVVLRLRACGAGSPAAPAARRPPARASRARARVAFAKAPGQRDGPARRSCSTSAARWARLVGQSERTDPPGAAARRRHGAVRRLPRRDREGARRRRRPAARPTRASRPAVRHAPDLAERPRRATSFFVCTANDVSKLPPEFTGPNGSTRSSSSTCPAPREKRAIWEMYLEQVRPRPRAAPAPRPRLDRRRDQGVLPAGGAARRPADRGGAEHRAGGRHGGRVGRAAAHLGQPGAACPPTGPASTPATARRRRQARPQRRRATRRPTDPRPSTTIVPIEAGGDSDLPAIGLIAFRRHPTFTRRSR